MQTNHKVFIAVAAAYWVVNNYGFIKKIQYLERENGLLKQDRKKLQELVNSMLTHTNPTPEEIQLAIDINFANMTKNI